MKNLTQLSEKNLENSSEIDYYYNQIQRARFWDLLNWRFKHMARHSQIWKGLKKAKRFSIQFILEQLDTKGGLYMRETIWQWVFVTLYEESRAKSAVISNFWTHEEFQEFSSNQDISSVQREDFEFTIKIALKLKKK